MDTISFNSRIIKGAKPLNIEFKRYSSISVDMKILTCNSILKNELAKSFVRLVDTMKQMKGVNLEIINLTDGVISEIDLRPFTDNSIDKGVRTNILSEILSNEIERLLIHLSVIYDIALNDIRKDFIYSANDMSQRVIQIFEA